jgi:hypothetical protein
LFQPTANLTGAIAYAKISDAMLVVVIERYRYYGELRSAATLELMGAATGSIMKADALRVAEPGNVEVQIGPSSGGHRVQNKISIQEQ